MRLPLAPAFLHADSTPSRPHPASSFFLLFVPSPTGRETLKELFSKGQVEGFHVSNYGRGHRATDYAKWFSTWLSYRIHYEEASAGGGRNQFARWFIRVCQLE